MQSSVQASVYDDSAALAALTEHFRVPLSPYPLMAPPLFDFSDWGAFCRGVWPWRTGGGTKRKSKVGDYSGGQNKEAWWWWRACVRARRCWLANADATQASAVSSQQLIPPSRSPPARPSDPGVLSSRTRGWKLRPPVCHIITVT